MPDEQVNRHFIPSKKSYFLFGPRGTGKSTWIKKKYANAKIIDFLEPDLVQRYKAQPMRLADFVYANPNNSVFVLDEVQKVPNLLNIVHKLIEENKKLQFILTGSSSRKLKQTGVDLLASRAQLKFMHPFMASELDEEFNLEYNLKLGMLPIILKSIEPEKDLKTYIALYIREEVMLEGLIRKNEQFSQFLESISFSQGSVLNYANIARDCHISNKTVESYVTILEDLLLSFRLPIFTKKAKRNIIRHPKFYFFDVGVFNSIRPIGPLDDKSSIAGHALETLVAQHLKAWIEYSDEDGKLYFWQTRGGLEVDFIIYGEIGFYAIEVKNTSNIKPSDLKGLQEFNKDYPESKSALLYRGKEKIFLNNVLLIPVEQFLLNLKINTPPF